MLCVALVLVLCLLLIVNICASHARSSKPRARVTGPLLRGHGTSNTSHTIIVLLILLLLSDTSNTSNTSNMYSTSNAHIIYF